VAVIPKGGGVSLSGYSEFPGVSLVIPIGAVTETFTITISAAGTTSLSQVGIAIEGWTYGTNSFNPHYPAMITMPASAVPYSQLGYSENGGATYIAIPLVSDSSTIVDYTFGTGYVVSGSNVIIYSYHLSIFGSFVNTAAVAAADLAAQKAADAKREAQKQVARVDITNSFTDAKAPTLEQFSTAEISGATSKNLAEINKELLALPLSERSDLAVIQKVTKKYGILDLISMGDKFTSVSAKDLSDVGLVPAAYRTSVTYALRLLPASERNDYAKIALAIKEKIAAIEKTKARLAALLSRRAK
jgi:hypothetical protein